MNEVYEFMKQVDVIVLFCLIYGLAINGIVWAVCEFFRFVVKKAKAFITKHKEKKAVQKDDMTGGGGYSSAAFVIERSSYAAFKH